MASRFRAGWRKSGPAMRSAATLEVQDGTTARASAARRNGGTMPLRGPWQGHGGRRRFRMPMGIVGGHKAVLELPGRRGLRRANRSPYGAGPTARAPALWDARLRASGHALRRIPRPTRAGVPPLARQSRARSALLPARSHSSRALPSRKKKQGREKYKDQSNGRNGLPFRALATIQYWNATLANLLIDRVTQLLNAAYFVRYDDRPISLTISEPRFLSSRSL